MRILFVTPQLPWPPDQGTRLRNLALVRAAAAAYQVDLLSFADREPDAGALAELGRLCGRVEALPAPTRTVGRRLLDLVRSPLPDLAQRLWSPDFAARLRALLAETPYDVVQVEGIELGRYLLLLRGAQPGRGGPERSEGPGHPRLVFDDHNVEYLLQRRACEADLGNPWRWHAALYSRVQWPRLERLEADVCRTADAVIAVSAEDAAALQRLAPGVAPRVVPNAIDVDAYPFVPGGRRKGATLLFTGKLDFRPNVDAVLWFADAVLPAIRARRPDAKLLVVGRDPDARLRRRADGDAGLALVGPVPDLAPYWQQATVAVLPMRGGGGVRFKALEAMACGIPLVSTGLGVEGIAAEPGWHYLRADDPADFAAAVLALLDDPERRDALARDARLLVEARYDASAVLPALLDLYRELLAGQAGT